MKKTDWAMIIVIVIIAGVVSYFVADNLLPSPNKDPQTVPTAEVISADVVEPSDDVFNEDALNPTVKSTVGNQNPEQPAFKLGEN